jgi:hypothetical protein
MLKVTITSASFREMKGTGKVSGKPYHMAMQTAYLHTIDRDGVHAPFPEKTEISLEKDEQGLFMNYQPGEYTLHPSSVYVDRDGKVAATLRLVSSKKST